MSRHRISCGVTTSYYALRVLPLFYVLVRLTSRTFHELFLTPNAEPITRPGFLMGFLTHLLHYFIIAVSLERHVALHNFIRSLCQFRRPNCSSARSPLLLLMDFLNICHDLEAADISISLLYGSHGPSCFYTIALSLGLCCPTTSVYSWGVDFVIRESASMRHAPTTIHCFESKPDSQCKTMKSIDP